MGLQRHPAVMSYPFVVAVLYVLTQLTMVIMRGWRNAAGVRWRFVCNHVGLWLAVMAGFWGAADNDILRTMVVAEQPSREAYYVDGRMTLLQYEMQLVDFRAEYFDNGTPSSYEADVAIDGRVVTLSVNNPYARTWSEDIYLVGYEPHGQSVACVVQVVRQPWKWPMAAGIVLLIVGAILMFVQGPQKRSV
jgi:cytochrome c biogenesis protein ResB